MSHYNYDYIDPIDRLVRIFTDRDPLFIRWLCAILIIYLQILTLFAFPMTIGYRTKYIVWGGWGGWLNRLINHAR